MLISGAKPLETLENSYLTHTIKTIENFQFFPFSCLIKFAKFKKGKLKFGWEKRIVRVRVRVRPSKIFRVRVRVRVRLLPKNWVRVRVRFGSRPWVRVRFGFGSVPNPGSTCLKEYKNLTRTCTLITIMQLN